MSARYTLYIGNKNISSWSLRPWLVMKTAKLAFGEVLIPLRKAQTSAAIKAHSPSAKVPALKIEENGLSRTVWDSLAICETLAERHPEARLWPEDAVARAEARSIVAEMHSGFPDLRRVLPMDLAARHPTPPFDDAVQTQIARVVTMWQSVLDRYGKNSGFLFGHFTIADAFYAPVATRFETYGVHLPAVAQAYTQRILATPAMREWEESAKAEAPP